MGLLDSLFDPFGQPEFSDGAGPAAVALAVVVVIGVLYRWGTARPAPIAGLAMAAAALRGMGGTVEVPDQLLVGVVICAGAGLLVDVFDASPVIVAVANVPGAIVVANAPGIDGVADSTVRTLAVAATVAAGGALVAAFDRRWRGRAWGPGLLAVTAGGIYATVPDTELALAFFGAVLVVTAAGWPVRIAHLGGAGSTAVVAVLAWSVAVGGVGRTGSVVGGLACLGMFVVDPAVRLLGARSPLRRMGGFAMTVTIVAAHVVLVLWMSRVAGLEDTADSAGVLVFVGFVVAGGGWVVAGRVRMGPASADDADEAAPRAGRVRGSGASRRSEPWTGKRS